MFIEKEKVEKRMVYSDMLYREIAIETGSLGYYDQVSGSSLKNLLKHNYIYNADMDVTDRYVKNFNEEFEPNPAYKLHKCYFDIEVDLMDQGFVKNKDGSIGYIGFPDEDEAPCPINIISMIDEKSMNIYSFILRNPLNTSLIEFEQNVEAAKQEVKDNLRERDDVIINNVFVSFYNSEEEVIEAYFNTLHMVDPDYNIAWNQSFDVKTMLNRLKKLYNRKLELKKQGITGYDAMLTTVSDDKYMNVTTSTGKEIYLTPMARYFADSNNKIVDRTDSFTVLDGIQWVDQMCYYANIRKVNGMKESYALDFIANEELGKEKLDYTGYTIKNLAWKNFKLFFLYNIMDVSLLMLLEQKNLDFDMIQRLSEITNTRHEKVFKKTVCLKNFVAKYAEEQGFIINNNKNATYGNDNGLFENEYLIRDELIESDQAYIDLFQKRENFGAYVGDPNLNSPNGIEVILGKASMFIFENVFDEDFSSLYPSIIQAYNLDKNTQVGKFFLIDNDTKERLINDFGYDDLFAVSANEEGVAGDVSNADLAPTMVDSIISHDWNKIGQKFFDLPSTTDMIKELTNR